MADLGLPKPFPPIEKEVNQNDQNPAIRLFGKRFLKGQNEIEYLSEFLSVLFSKKWVREKEIEDILPKIEEIKDWKNLGVKLFYRPPIKLSLKLFAFLGSSRIDSRHKVHQDQYKRLNQRLTKKIGGSKEDPNDVLEEIEKLLRGYKGVGFNRTWCAQTFYPLSQGLITQETIWNESIAKRKKIDTWDETIRNFRTYFSNKRAFFSRGGEVLFLQICNLFSQNEDLVREFENEAKIKGENEFDNLKELHGSLVQGFEKLKGTNTEGLEKIVDFIENADSETKRLTNKEAERLSCEWCPEDSWPEGYLFAVEIVRLLKASIDPVERLELLMIGCIMQVMRSVCAQSIRYLDDRKKKTENIQGFAWIFTPSSSPSRQQRVASQRNLQVILANIQKALRTDSLEKNASRVLSSAKMRKIYKEADDKYGHKLFLSLGKRLEIIAPYKGPGARFVMTDGLLRYLVLTLIPPGGSCTYEEFLEKLYKHYGIAIEGKNLAESAKWSGFLSNSSLQPRKRDWLMDMLRAGGFLTELSDALSIVNNNFEEVTSSSLGGNE